MTESLSETDLVISRIPRRTRKSREKAESAAPKKAVEIEVPSSPVPEDKKPLPQQDEAVAAQPKATPKEVAMPKVIKPRVSVKTTPTLDPHCLLVAAVTGVPLEKWKVTGDFATYRSPEGFKPIMGAKIQMIIVVENSGSVYHIEKSDNEVFVIDTQCKGPTWAGSKGDDVYREVMENHDCQAARRAYLADPSRILARSLASDVLQGLRMYYPAEVHNHEARLREIAIAAFRDSWDTQRVYGQMRDAVERAINAGLHQSLFREEKTQTLAHTPTRMTVQALVTRLTETQGVCRINQGVLSFEDGTTVNLRALLIS